MKRCKAFTLIELLVVVAIIALLISILLPSLSKARELAKRSVCAANLGGAGKAIAMYASASRGNFPTTTKARIRPTPNAGSVTTPPTRQATTAQDGNFIMFFDYNAAAGFTSPNDGTNGPHRWQAIVGGTVAPTGKAVTQIKGTVGPPATEPKDTSYGFPTRELFLLVKNNYGQAAQFVCPSTSHESDPMWGDKNGHTQVRNAMGLGQETQIVPSSQLWDFLGPDNLDYGYIWGHDADGEALNESMDPQAPVMADSNPYMRRQINGERVPTDPIVNHKMGDNSPNHLTEGQNVLFGDLHAQFYDHPTVGVGTDNIYTYYFSKANADITIGVSNLDLAPTWGSTPATGDVSTTWNIDLVSRTDCILLP